MTVTSVITIVIESDRATTSTGIQSDIQDILSKYRRNENVIAKMSAIVF